MCVYFRPFTALFRESSDFLFLIFSDSEFQMLAALGVNENLNVSDLQYGMWKNMSQSSHHFCRLSRSF